MSISKQENGALPGKQETALNALLAHPTFKDAAQAAGVSEVTLWRYLREEKFAARYRTARREVVEHATMRLQHHAGDAAQTLHEIAVDKDSSASARVAARAILDQSLRAVELGEMQARVEQLETHINRLMEQRLLDEAAEETEP
jgi:hypothetical protein